MDSAVPGRPASGIGAESARLFAAHGAGVAIADLDDNLGRQVAGEIAAAGGAALYLHLDTTVEDEWRFVDTPMTRAIHDDPERAALRLAQTPAGRFGQPIDIAFGCLFLASDESTWMTGAELVIDGGMTAV